MAVAAGCLPAPENVQASDGLFADRIRISWDGVEGATGYIVQRAKTPYFPSIGMQAITLDPVVGLCYDDLTAPADRVWFYRVLAVGSCGKGTPSSIGSGRRGSLPGPECVHATKGEGSSHVTITWCGAAEADEYAVYRASTELAEDAKEVWRGGATSYDDSNVECDKSYWYSVRYHTRGSGKWSALSPLCEESHGWPAACEPIPAPTGVQASDGTVCAAIRVTWDLVARATKYRVEWAVSSGGPFIPFAEAVVAPPYNDASVPACESRWYQVRAWVEDRWSDPSASNQGTRGCVPAAVTNVEASDGEFRDQIRVTWRPVQGAVSYEVQYSATGGESTFALDGVIAGPPYIDPSHKDGWYRVRACGSCGESAPSNQDHGSRKLECVTWDMESGPAWTVTGLWHYTESKSHSTLHALWFGNPSTGTYGPPPSGVSALSRSTASAFGPQAVGGVRGTATSPMIQVASGTSVELSFWHWREVESYPGSFDRTSVCVRFEYGVWSTVWEEDSSDISQAEWKEERQIGSENKKLLLSVPGRASWMQVQFVFDSVDSVANGYGGWYIDDVSVCPSTTLLVPARVQTLGGEGLTAVCRPNPVEDVHTAIFSVWGVTPEAVRVELYDVSGVVVFSSESAGPELVWHTEDSAGQFLANGVYLYRMWVLVDGVWMPCPETGKVVILR